MNYSTSYPEMLLKSSVHLYEHVFDYSIDGSNSPLLPSKAEHSAPLFDSGLDYKTCIGMLGNMTQPEAREVLVHWDLLSHCSCSFTRTMRICQGQLAEEMWETPGGELSHHYADHPTTTSLPRSLQLTGDTCRCLRESHWDQSS